MALRVDTYLELWDEEPIFSEPPAAAPPSRAQLLGRIEGRSEDPRLGELVTAAPSSSSRAGAAAARGGKPSRNGPSNSKF
jgi:hypothetical protein